MSSPSQFYSLVYLMMRQFPESQASCVLNDGWRIALHPRNQSLYRVRHLCLTSQALASPRK